MEYLHLFKTKSEHDAFYFGDKYKEPWVAYIEDEKVITYNKPHDYSKDYFTIEALGNGNVYFKYNSSANTGVQRYMEYSKDGGETWIRTTNVNGEEVIMTIPLLNGEKALVRGDNDTLNVYDVDEDDWFGSFFYSDIEFNVFGNIMSLIHDENFINEINVVEHMFEGLFFDSWSEYVGDDKADCMIVNAKNLILPATTLTDYCYSGMFWGCTSLVTAPELPATTLAVSCYASMFSGCTSLATAPELPATTLAVSCYASMFSGCTSLATAPELPATTLAQYCYQNMFYGCTSLTTAPELPATTLIGSCYAGMFDGCTSLTTAPELPATTLASNCYGYMFNGCMELTTAPELPATTLASGCYTSMFQGCRSLNYIKAMFTTTPSTTYTRNWVSGVAATGTFVKNSAATWTTRGAAAIPRGWTVQTASA